MITRALPESRTVDSVRVLTVPSRETQPYFARCAAEAGDDGINDLLVSGVIRTNEMHVWFVAEHLVDPAVQRAS